MTEFLLLLLLLLLLLESKDACILRPLTSEGCYIDFIIELPQDAAVIVAVPRALLVAVARYKTRKSNTNIANVSILVREVVL